MPLPLPLLRYFFRANGFSPSVTGHARVQLEQRKSIRQVGSLVLFVHEARVVTARKFRQPQGEAVLEVAVQDLV